MFLIPGIQGLEHLGLGRLQLAKGGLLRVPGGRGQRRGGEPGAEVRRISQGSQPQWLPGKYCFIATHQDSLI